MDHTGISSSVWSFSFNSTSHCQLFSFSFHQKQHLLGWGFFVSATGSFGLWTSSLWGIMYIYFSSVQSLINHIILISTLLLVFVFCWNTVSFFRSLIGLQISLDYWFWTFVKLWSLAALFRLSVLIFFDLVTGQLTTNSNFGSWTTWTSSQCWFCRTEYSFGTGRWAWYFYGDGRIEW